RSLVYENLILVVLPLIGRDDLNDKGLVVLLRAEDRAGKPSANPLNDRSVGRAGFSPHVLSTINLIYLPIPANTPVIVRRQNRQGPRRLDDLQPNPSGKAFNGLARG